MNKPRILRILYATVLLLSSCKIIALAETKTLTYPDGDLKAEYGWENGKMHGPYMVYHENGQLKVKGMYEDGRQVRVWLTYDENGNEIGRVNYDDLAAEVESVQHTSSNNKRSDEISIERLGFGNRYYQNENRLTLPEMARIIRPVPEARTHFRTAMFMNISAAVFAVSAGYMLGTAAGRAIKEQEVYPAIPIIGATCLVVAIPMSIGSNIKFRRSVETYNKSL